MKQLVESGANINARSRESKNHTALHEAVIGGHKEVAQFLLEMGANQVEQLRHLLHICSALLITSVMYTYVIDRIMSSLYLY